MQYRTRLGFGVILGGGLVLLGLAASSRLTAIAPRWATLHTTSLLPLATLSPREVTPDFIVSQAQINPPKLISQRATTMHPQLVKANTQFGFKLFSAIANQQPNQNIFVSPSSIAIALSMVYNGASGRTQAEMAKTLNLQGIDLATLNQASADLIALLENPDPKVKLAIANSLWARQGVPFKPDFVQHNQRYYQAKLTELNFANPDAVSTINRWVQNHTQGKITEIVDQLNPNDIMILINAIYFKGNWSRQFDQQRTTTETFYLANGEQKKHPLMAQQGEYRYLENSLFQGVMLPYGDRRRMSMIILLPHKNLDLVQLQRNLSAENWESWMNQFRTRQGSIQIPRFRLTYETELTRVLSQLGMASAFSNQADFSGISPIPTQIDEVKHKTFIEVNEEGTEAAAVTSIGIRATAAIQMDQPFRMKVDRPFFCAIQDNQTGAIIFMGAIANP